MQGWRSFASSSARLSSSSLHHVYKEMRGTTKKRVKIKKASVLNNRKKSQKSEGKQLMELKEKEDNATRAALSCSTRSRENK